MARTQRSLALTYEGVSEVFLGSGPCRIVASGGADERYAWTRYATMVYLDLPSGGDAGFSLGGAPSSEASLEGEVGRFLSVFYKQNERLTSNDLYIFSKGIGARIAPRAANHIVQHYPSINLRGVGIGSAMIAPETQYMSMPDYLERNPYDGAIVSKKRLKFMRDDLAVCLSDIEYCRTSCVPTSKGLYLSSMRARCPDAFTA